MSEEMQFSIVSLDIPSKSLSSLPFLPTETIAQGEVMILKRAAIKNLGVSKAYI
jgi:hypothetical protein